MTDFNDKMRHLFGEPNEAEGRDGHTFQMWRIHPKHAAAALINQDIADNGTPWNKCLDCGTPYVIGGEDWPESSSTFCSDNCEANTRAYLTDPNAGY